MQITVSVLAAGLQVVLARAVVVVMLLAFVEAQVMLEAALLHADAQFVAD